MKTQSATEAKTHFGEVLETAQKEPVMIEKAGKKYAVVLSFEEYQRLASLENSYWIAKAEKGKKEGFIGEDASEALIGSLLHARD